MSTQKLTRSRRDRRIAGVCGGLAEYSGIDVTIIRILFVVFALAGGPGFTGLPRPLGGFAQGQLSCEAAPSGGFFTTRA